MSDRTTEKQPCPWGHKGMGRRKGNISPPNLWYGSYRTRTMGKSWVHKPRRKCVLTVVLQNEKSLEQSSLSIFPTHSGLHSHLISPLPECPSLSFLLTWPLINGPLHLLLYCPFHLRMPYVYNKIMNTLRSEIHDHSFIYSANSHWSRIMCQALSWVPGIH